MQEKDCYIKLKINDAWPFTDNGRMFTIYRNNPFSLSAVIITNPQISFYSL